MGVPVLIMGPSGSGKSASLRNFKNNLLQKMTTPKFKRRFVSIFSILMVIIMLITTFLPMFL